MPQAFPATVAIPAGGAFELPGFRIGRTPITNAEYGLFLPAHRAGAPPWWNDPDFSDPFQPVVGVTWGEAAAYCDWLTSRDSGRWRLPSEAEWERAISGGAESPRTAWGDSVPPGEIPDGPLRGPWKTGRGTPNGYGVLDPGSVVHEWCLEWREPESLTPDGCPAPLARRASRGGSWRHRVRWSAPSARSSLPPDFRYSDFGFRVLREEGG